MARARWIGVLLCATPGALCAQPAPMSFEVASIKASAPDTRGMFIQFQPGGGLRVTNLTVKQVLAYGYDVRDFQISGGPAWINSDRYDIQARPEHTATTAAPDDYRQMTDEQRKTLDQQMRERVRTLLADRFELAVHHDTKEAPVYVLMVAKGGPKLKENTEPRGGRQGMGMRPGGQLTATAAPLPMLANLLSNLMGRPVLDKTGLTAKYDFELHWTPDSGKSLVPPGAPAAAVEAQAPDPNGPTIFTALQEQLGLRLESQKGPVDMIVIDRVEKPSEN